MQKNNRGSSRGAKLLKGCGKGRGKKGRRVGGREIREKEQKTEQQWRNRCIQKRVSERNPRIGHLVGKRGGYRKRDSSTDWFNVRKVLEMRGGLNCVGLQIRFEKHVDSQKRGGWVAFVV